MEHIDVNLIKDLLENKKIDKVKKIIGDADIPSLAIMVDQLGDKRKIEFYLLLPTKISSEVLLEVSLHSRKFILKSLKDKYIISMIENAESDDSADILGEIPEHKVKRIFALLPRKKKEAIAPLIKYEEDTAGGLMQSELVAASGTIKVKDAIETIKKKAKDMDGFNYVYIVDDKERLRGVVSIRDLITSPSEKKLYQIMKKEVVKLNPDLDKEKVAEVFRNEDLFALPVADKNGKLLGRVTIDDVLDVMEEEATEDMFKIAGVHPDESIFDPLKKSLKRRLPWLIVNLGTAILAALTVSLFRDTLQAVIILAAFMPIIAGMGGNAGTQTLTLIVRGIALNQLNLSNYKKVLLKEVSLGMINGVVIGIIMGIIASLWTGNYMIGLVILMAMTINLIVAGFIGTSIPILLKRFKIDPAVASSVFITTFTDVIGFFTFLGISTLLINFLVV
ncbi:MAG: magnesium transporter [Nanoarchaeota archaeon]|nr:magnesium transporter [Nanoarchaeota archaeon]